MYANSNKSVTLWTAYRLHRRIREFDKHPAHRVPVRPDLTMMLEVTR